MSTDSGLLQDYLAAAGAPPDKVAVTDGRTALSWGEVAARSDRLARLLTAAGVGRGDRVVVCLRRSPEFLPAILGILQAGAAYVPLDPKSPPERWRRIVADCAPRLLLGDSHTLQPLATVAGTIPTVDLKDADCSPAAAGTAFPAYRQYGPAAPLAPELTPDDLAYILYTSGSTGTPKGVMITHRNVRNYIDWAVDCFAIQAGDRILGTAPFHFDMSTFDLWCAVKTGAGLCLADEAMTLFPEKLLAFMERERVTLWKGISSLLLYLERGGVLAPGRVPGLSRIIFSGEALPARSLIRWMETFPEKFFCNAYGPTEATGISLYYPVARIPAGAGERIPIGSPCKGMRAAVVDDALQAVGAGAAGELLLSGPGLGTGYLNDPERTAKSFVQAAPFGGPAGTWYRTGDLVVQRPEGHFEFIGRLDHQVKIMGYRIELGEIEQALRAVDGVGEAAVIAADRGGITELIAFFEAAGAVDPASILQHLRNRLPGYMLPRRLLPVAGLPRCGRGKIDRESLRLLAAEGRHATG